MTQGNIYFDFNATTPVDSRVQAKVQDWLSFWGNPSSIHLHGRGPKKILRESRRGIASKLSCHPLELVFTSGGSEANNLAIKGCALAVRSKNKLRNKILLGAIEHPSILRQKTFLESLGFVVKIIPVNQNGSYDLAFYKKELDQTVALVSVMLANNELGVIAPIQTLVEMAHNVGAYFHSDMVQALGKYSFDLKALGVDLASFSSHKVYAIKGSGLLYVKKGTTLEAITHGGSQERSRRAGTENLLSIASFAFMIEKLCPDQFNENIKPLREEFEKGLKNYFPNVIILCEKQQRLANTVCFCLPEQNGETLLMNLDIRGFSVGTGAACSSGNPEPSPVLLAIGLKHNEAQSSLRISFGKETTRQEVQALLKNLKEVVDHLSTLKTEGAHA